MKKIIWSLIAAVAIGLAGYLFLNKEPVNQEVVQSENTSENATEDTNDNLDEAFKDFDQL